MNLFSSLKLATITTGVLLASNIVIGHDFSTGETSTQDISKKSLYQQSFLEENDLYIPVSAKSVSSVSHNIFNKTIDDIYAVYSPIIQDLGGKLKFEKNWNSGTVNAYANRSGRTWSVHLFGGLARHQKMTPDGFALVVCHELGHHIGGAPKTRTNSGGAWASNEGQSDYWAALKCLRRIWEKDDNEEIVSKLKVPALVTKLCLENFQTANDLAICKRSALAGKAASSIFETVRNGRAGVDFSTPDRNVVRRTDDAHPKAQCRLDTYFAGAVCKIPYDKDVSQTDSNQATCNLRDGYTSGLRPLCWYKPSSSY